MFEININTWVQYFSHRISPNEKKRQNTPPFDILFTYLLLKKTLLSEGLRSLLENIYEETVPCSKRSYADRVGKMKQ